MERNLEEIIHTVTQLPEQDRATLAGLLLASLEAGPDADVDAAWNRELQKRVADVEAGAVELIPWETVRKELFSSLNDG